MKTLKEILIGDLEYSSSWGIYAEPVEGKFQPDSPARFGQKIFENGGLLDECLLFANNESVLESRANYCGLDEEASEFYEEWAEQYIDEMSL